MVIKKKPKSSRPIKKDSAPILTALQIYSNEINDIPLLTSEQEVELASKIQAGDIEARNKLVKHNLKLVRHIAQDYRVLYNLNPEEFADTQQHGVIGCIKAADDFDPLKNLTPEGNPARFVSYAYPKIRVEIDRAIKSPSEGIRNDKHIPLCFQELVRKMPSFKKQFEEEKGRAPERDELIQYLHTKFNYRKYRIIAALNFEDMGNKSLDYVPPNSDESLLETISGSEHHDPVSTNFDNGNKSSLLESYIEKLPESYKDIWKLRFGLFDEGLLKKYGFDNEKLKLLILSDEKKHRTNSDALPFVIIGKMMGVSKQAVYEKFKSGLKTIRSLVFEDPNFEEHKKSLEERLLYELTGGNPEGKDASKLIKLFFGGSQRRTYELKRETPLDRFNDLRDCISHLPEETDRELVRLFYQVDSGPLVSRYKIDLDDNGRVSLGKIAKAWNTSTMNVINHLKKSEEIIEYMHLGINVGDLESMRAEVITKYVDIARQALSSIKSEKSKRILSLKFGLEGGVIHSYSEIAQILGIERQKIYNLYNAPYKELWKNMKPLLEKEFI